MKVDTHTGFLVALQFDSVVTSLRVGGWFLHDLRQLMEPVVGGPSSVNE